MAEAIGVVAGALSVLSAANTAYSRIDELLKSISNAPDTLQDLRRDVQQTRDLLAQVGESVPNLSRSTEFSLFLSKLGATTTRLLEALPAPDLQTRLARRTKLRVLRLEKEKLTRAADALLNNRHELQRLAQSPAILELQAISTHDFLQWLAAPEFSGVHKRLYENHVVGNIGHDVVDDVRFKSWVRTPGKALWYTGPAGSGKTLQFSVTVNFLGDKFRAPNFVGYIYFGVQDLEPVDIVCSLIKQFIVALHKPTIDNKLKEWYSRGKGNRSDYADATAILGHLMQQAPRAFLLFDAIDEFPGHTKELVHDLQMRMGRMRRNPPNVLLTSREQLVSEPLFEDAFKLEIRPRLDEISTFVSRELSKMNLSLLLTTEQENKLVSNIVSRASGSFLWAQLALGVLDPQSIHSEWKKVISIAQLQLGEFYTTILDRITHKVGDSYEMMLQILTWLTYSNTRLKRDELEAALGINTARARENTNGGLSLKQFVDVARPLVEEEYDGSVVLIHNSLKDYLHKWLPTQLEIPSLATTPDLLIARRCLNYLRQKPFAKKSLREVDEIQERLAEYPFLRYAAVNWGHHARKCCDKTLKDEIMAFLEAGFPMEAACLILGSCENNMEHYDEAYQRMTGIHLASAFGLHQVVEELLDTDLSDICSKTDGHWTAIHWASWKGYDRVITTILSKLKRSEDSLTALRWTTSLRCWTALHLAAKEGHLSVVKILHEYGGINIDVADLQRRTALYLACWGKHTPVVRFLMLNGADPNLQDAFGMTALHCAAKGGDLQLVKEILSLGHNRLNLNIADLLGHTSLDEAKRKGHDAIAQLLENLGATSSSKNASRPLTVNLAEFSIWKDIPRDTDWSCYELDPEITRSTRKGAQATCEVLRNSKDRKMMVFRKAFKSTTDLIMRGSETEHSKTIQKYSLSEGQILYTLWHPHIVLYLDSDIDPERNTFNLYLEYCDSGDLRSIYGLPLKPDDAKDETDRTYGFLDSSETPQLMAPPLNGVQLWGLIWQLSSALAYLHYGLSMQHESGQLKAVFECDWEYVIHRDVKPENVVRKKTPDGKYVFKLCDLGIATPAGRYDSIQNQTRYIGTSAFRPEEVIQGNAWSRKGDMYSLQATIRHIHKAKDDLVNPSNKSFDSFMSKCGNSIPSKRLTSLSIMELAHKELVASKRIGELPPVVVEEIESVHDLLTCHGDDYLLGAVACVAGHLDAKIAIDDPLFKQHRHLTVQQLEAIFADGAKKSFKSYRCQYSIHVLAVLHQPSSGKPNNGRVSSEYLEKALEVCEEPDSTLQQSGWTPLHLAAQQGNIEATEILLRYGADMNVKDIHKKTPYDYGLMLGMDLMMLKMGGLAVKG